MNYLHNNECDLSINDKWNVFVLSTLEPRFKTKSYEEQFREKEEEEKKRWEKLGWKY